MCVLFSTKKFKTHNTRRSSERRRKKEKNRNTKQIFVFEKWFAFFLLASPWFAVRCSWAKQESNFATSDQVVVELHWMVSTTRTRAPCVAKNCNLFRFPHQPHSTRSNTISFVRSAIRLWAVNPTLISFLCVTSRCRCVCVHVLFHHQNFEIVEISNGVRLSLIMFDRFVCSKSAKSRVDSI